MEKESQLQTTTKKQELALQMLRDQSLTNFQINPKAFYTTLAVRGFNECIQAPTPTLAGIRAHYGKDVGNLCIRAFLNVILVDLVNFFNLGKSMNSEQVVITAQLISEEFYMLKPEDFKLCFDAIKKGYFGKLYDRIDGQVILSTIRTYLESRIDFAKNEQMDKHSSYKTDARGTLEDRYNVKNSTRSENQNAHAAYEIHKMNNPDWKPLEK